MEGNVWEYLGEGRWLSTALLLCAMISAWRAIELLVWRPRRIKDLFASQGIRGPPYRFFVGNLVELFRMMVHGSSAAMEHPFSHDVLSRILPFYTEWSKIYGSTFLMWCGPIPRVTIAEPDLVREILTSKADVFDRIESHTVVRELEGGGILNLQGERWAHRRQISSPFFHISNLSLLIPVIGNRMEEMTEKWAVSEEVEVSDHFDRIAAEVMSRVVCGPDYKIGEEVINLQTEVMGMPYNTYLIPGYSYLPTKMNITFWSLRYKIQSSLDRIIRQRRERVGRQENELIDLLLGACSEESSLPSTAMSPRDIAEECKGFLFAGRKTVSSLLSWTTIMLAMSPKWQDLAREEIRLVCGSSGVPSSGQIGKLKTLSMILNETLRLYPPVVAIVRTAKAQVEIGGKLTMPRGTHVLIPILALHHDRKLWGEDASEFNPGRFINGVAQAAPPAAFMPFGHGGRACAGQNLAMLEAKLCMALLIRKFSFLLSPAYVHAPRVKMMLGPQHGAPIVFKLLSGDAGEDNECLG